MIESIGAEKRARGAEAPPVFIVTP